MNKDDYMKIADRCKQGIDKIKEIILSAKTKKKQAELAVQYANDLNILEKQYRINRSAYDVLFFAYEYFSDDRNPENDGNLIPAGCKLEDAPEIHVELCHMLDQI